MHLVKIKETKDEQSLSATLVYAPKANNLSSGAPMRVRKGQHLDVDGILARSLPNLGASFATDVKTIER
jgi:hypothetical protein